MEQTSGPQHDGDSMPRGWDGELTASAFYDHTHPYNFRVANTTEADLLEAGRQCLIRVGPVRMTMSDVARTSGYSRPTVYKYFVDKRAVLHAFVDHSARAVSRDLARGLAQAATFVDRIVVFIEIIRKSQQVEALSFFTREDRAYFSTDPDLVRVNWELWRAELLPYVDRAQREHEICEVLHPYAVDWILRFIRSFVVTPSFDIDVDSSDQLHEFLESCLMNGLRERRTTAAML